MDILKRRDENKLIDTDNALFCQKAELFCPDKTFECGQCFRWEACSDGSYIGIAGGHIARVICRGGTTRVISAPESADFWRLYFDLDRDYETIRKSFFCGDPFTAKAAEYGAGMRILRQEPWEALCSFIISQCNNIPRIKSIINKLCELFGEQKSFDGITLCAFPSAQAIADLSEADLAPLRAGYRIPYIISAARAAAQNQIDFDSLKKMSFEQAEREIMRLPGVGKKVANCFLLFGLAKTEAFPVDTWMKKAQKYYDFPLSASQFGEYAGIAQQYIFYYIRSLQK